MARGCQVYFREGGREEGKMNIVTTGKKYRVIKDFYVEALPLKYFAKKGEILIADWPSLGYANLRSEKSNRSVVMSLKEAVEFLEELPNSEIHNVQKEMRTITLYTIAIWAMMFISWIWEADAFMDTDVSSYVDNSGGIP